MDDALKLWTSISNAIQKDINEITFQAFIFPIQAGFIDSSTLYLESPNLVCSNLVTNKYLNLIIKTAKELDHRIKSVQILLPNEIEDLRNSLKTNSEEKSTVNKKFTFENFVVGNNNRFVYTVALAVAEQPAEVYNPLFIYGGVGLGKTHLLHAVGNFVQEFRPELKVKYITAESFMNDLIKNLRFKEASSAFRSRYRNLDILMIDDIQFMAGKEATQEEFFHTFNALYNDGKQIIITCDKHPTEVKNLEARLSSRFQMGLIADIQTPDIETRIAILKKKAEIAGIEATDEAFNYIAEKFNSNVRELEGALTKIRAFAAMNKRNIDLSVAKEALADAKPKDVDVQASCDRILNVVSSHYGITVGDLKGTKRSRGISEPRQIAMYLVREILAMPFANIGKTFGDKDHTTVMHAYNKINSAKNNSPRLAAEIKDLINMIDIN